MKDAMISVNIGAQLSISPNGETIRSTELLYSKFRHSLTLVECPAVRALYTGRLQDNTKRGIPCTSCSKPWSPFHFHDICS